MENAKDCDLHLVVRLFKILSVFPMGLADDGFPKAEPR